MSDTPRMTEVAESRARDLIAQVENLPVAERNKTLARMFKETVEGGAFTLFDLFLRARIRFATEALVSAHPSGLSAAQAAVHALRNLQQDMFEGEAEDVIQHSVLYTAISPFAIIDRGRERAVPLAGR